MNLFGVIFVNIFFAGLWTILGMIIDKITTIFNMTIQLMPTMQDFVNGFTMVQTIWVALPLLVFVFTVMDYVLSQNETGNAVA